MNIHHRYHSRRLWEKTDYLGKSRVFSIQCLPQGRFWIHWDTYVWAQAFLKNGKGANVSLGRSGLGVFESCNKIWDPAGAGRYIFSTVPTVDWVLLGSGKSNKG